MSNSVGDIVEATRSSPNNVRFSDLEKVCDHFFLNRHSKKTSHKTYKTPWPGDPRVNIQDASGKAKPYQVRQVLQAIDKLKALKSRESEQDNGHQ